MRFSLTARALFVLLMAFAVAAARPARAATPSLAASDIVELNRQVQDSTTAGAALERLRAFLATDPEPMYRVWARNQVLIGLISLRAPTPEVLAAADTAEKYLPQAYQARAQFYSGVAEALGERPDGVAPGLAYARKAIDALPPTPDVTPYMGMARSVLGTLQLKNGETAAAIASFQQALPASPDSQRVLVALGRAYEKAGKPDAALNAYLRSAGVFGGSDSSGAAPLRALWIKRHGSLVGLDARIAAVRKVSVQRVALDAHRDERPAPEFRLPKLVDTTATVSLANLKGKVAVVDFWGSWCGPCRYELPIFQKLYERYKDHPGVTFLAINWERPALAAERKQRAWDYMVQNKLTFPTVFDLEAQVVSAYKVDGFPTLFVIDREGRIRYSNRGFDPSVESLVEAQIGSLLE